MFDRLLFLLGLFLFANTGLRLYGWIHFDWTLRQPFAVLLVFVASPFFCLMAIAPAYRPESYDETESW